MNSLTDEVRHLLVSFPDDGEAGEPWAVLDGLLMRVMIDLIEDGRPTALLSQEEITRHLTSRTGLAFDLIEVQDALIRLKNKRQLTFADREEKSIAPNPEAVRIEKDKVSKRIHMEQTVKHDWLRSLLERNPDLRGTTAEEFWQALQAALGRLVNSRSAEAAAFLYLDRKEARALFDEVLNESRSLDDLPNRPEGVAPELFRSEVARFVLDAEGLQADFLLTTLNAAFQYHLINLDPGAARLARSVVGSKIFYLDTNFLFRLLALHGPREAHGPALIADLASELSTDLRVARATVDEFKSSVGYLGREVRQSFLQRDDFRKIAADHGSTDLGFMTEFYRQLQSGLVRNVNEFESKCLQIERALEDWGIEVDEQCPWDQDTCRELTDRSLELKNWTSGKKSESSCEHDVLMEYYVRKIRKAHRGGLNDVDVWFLTYDRRLTRFFFRKPIEEDLPVTLLAEDWLQIVRYFSPRTEEYDRAFLSLLSSTLLIDDQTVPFPHVVNALSRLERYEGLSAKVVAGMIVEREFVRRLNEPLDDREERQFVELNVARVASQIEGKLDKALTRVKQVESDHDRVAGKLGETRARIEEMKAEHDRALGDLGQAQTRVEQAESARDRTLRERDESESTLKGLLEDREETVKEAVISKTMEETRLRRQIAALRFALTVVSALALVVAVVWLWSPVVVGGPLRWRLFLCLCAGALQASATGFLWGHRKPGAIAGVVVLVVTLLQFLLGN